MDNIMVMFQCLLFVFMYCIIWVDYKRFQYYKGIVVGLLYWLGFYQSQKWFLFGVLIIEICKKVFWLFYMFDWYVYLFFNLFISMLLIGYSFFVVLFGFFKFFKEEDIYCEFLFDIDDEYVMEKGFQLSFFGEVICLFNVFVFFWGF